MASLDIREPQILVFFEPDQVQWHHRVLLRRLHDAVWVLATPELEVQVEDLSRLRIATLPPAANIPAQLDRENVHLFAALTDQQLQDLHAQASRMAAVLGGAAVQPEDSVPGRAHWLASDPALESFGEPITDDIVNNGATGVTRNSIGMALVGGVWLPAERVADKDQTRWESAKRNGPRRDPRLAGDRRDSQNRRWLSLSDAVNTLRPTDLKKQKDWPHPGPRASEEVPAGIRAAGREIIPYHDLWVSQVGIHRDSSIAWEHKMLLTILAFMLCFDQLDITNTASGEFLCRRLLQLQRAVRANPRSPDFTGLHKMIEHHLDEAGGVTAREFTKHIAVEAESEARILKQNRLLREETKASQLPTSSGDGGDGKDEGKPGGRRRGKNS
jgi:hypothetical protein